MDVRIIAATNANLEEEIGAGRFRQDLYDRLRFEVFRIPPLRERREDIPLLADFFVEEIAKEVPGVKPRPFSRTATDCLRAYGWPGNIRELKFAAERAACMAGEDQIQPGDLPIEVCEGGFSPSEEGFESQAKSFELGLLRNALQSQDWNQRLAAEHLRLTYDQFRHLYRKYHLDREKP